MKSTSTCLYKFKYYTAQGLLLVLLLAKRRELLDVRNSSTPGPTVTNRFCKRPIASQTMPAVPRIYSLFTYHSLTLPSIRRQVLDQLLSPFTDDWPHQHLHHADFQATNSGIQGAVLTSVSHWLRCGHPRAQRALNTLRLISPPRIIQAPPPWYAQPCFLFLTLLPHILTTLRNLPPSAGSFEVTTNDLNVQSLDLEELISAAAFDLTLPLAMGACRVILGSLQ